LGAAVAHQKTEINENPKDPEQPQPAPASLPLDHEFDSDWEFNTEEALQFYS
jgi:hypothetical protein